MVMITEKMKNLLKDFAQEEQGSVVIIFALMATLILILTVGFAIDLTRAEILQGRMYSAADASALAVENGYAQSVRNQTAWNSSIAQGLANRYFVANLPPGYLGAGTTTPQISLPTPGDWSTVTVLTNTNQSTYVMKDIGHKNVTVGSTSTVTDNVNNGMNIEVALILDNSAAMAANMGSLKTAASSLVTTIFGSSATLPNVYVSLIPYSDAVKINPGSANPNAWLGYSPNGTPLAYSASYMSDFDDCMVNRTNGYLATDKGPYPITTYGFPRYKGPFDISSMIKVTTYKAATANKGVNAPPNQTIPFFVADIINNNLDPNSNSYVNNLNSANQGAVPIHNGERLALDLGSAQYLNQGSRFPGKITWMHCSGQTDGPGYTALGVPYDVNDWHCVHSTELNTTDLMRVDLGAAYISAFGNFYINDLNIDSWADWWDQQGGWVGQNPANCKIINWTIVGHSTSPITGPTGVWGCVEQAHVNAFDRSYNPINITIKANFNGSTTTSTNGDLFGIVSPYYETLTINPTNSSNLFRYIEFTAKDDGSRIEIWNRNGSYPNWDDNSDYHVNGFDLQPHCTPLQYSSFFMQNQTAILSQINSMSPAGPTRNDVGLAWGWFSLSPNWQGVLNMGVPSEPQSYTANSAKVAVIMTQGVNASPQYDTNFAQICTAMKSAGIIVYTVAFNTSASVQTLLQNCASPNDYFYAGNASQLNQAFTTIGQNVGQMASLYDLRVKQ